MPSLNGKSVLLKELNNLNGQSYTFADVDIRRLAKVEHAQLLALPTGALAGMGSGSFTHRAIDLNELGQIWPNTIVILRTPTLLEAITRISQQLGITFSSTDLMDVPIPDTGGVITLTAANTSLVFKGSTNVTVQVKSIPTAVIYPLTDLTRTNPWDGPGLVAAFGARNGRPDIQTSGYAVGTPKTITGTYNTEVPLTAKSAYGYVGDTAVQYNRTNLTAVGTQSVIWNRPWSGTTYQFLQRFLPSVAKLMTADDIVNNTVTFNGTQSIPVPVQSVTGALNIIGDLTVSLMAGNPYAYAQIRNLTGQTLYKIMGTANVRNLTGQTLYKVLGTAKVRNLTAQVLYKVN